MTVQQSKEQQSRRRGKTQKTLQLHVSLRGADPAIWRVIEVPETATLWDLHCMLSDVFGWNDTHLHQFILPLRVPYEGQSMLCTLPFGIPDEDDELPVIADWFITLGDLLHLKSPAFVAPTGTFHYLYDFGDGWNVTIRTQVIQKTSAERQIRCIAGERSGPPDDFGGIEIFNDYIAGRVGATERRERLAWLQEVAPGWTPDGWRVEDVTFSDSQQRLRDLLDDMRHDDIDLPSRPRTRIDKVIATFATNFPRRIKPVVESTEIRPILLPVAIIKGTAYLYCYRGERSGGPRPFSFRHIEGRPPIRTMVNQIGMTIYPRSGREHVRESIIVPLSARYRLDIDESEAFHLPFLALIPTGREADDYHQANNDSVTLATPVGRITELPVPPDHLVWATQPPQDGDPVFVSALRMLVLLTTHNLPVRDLLGLSPNQYLHLDYQALPSWMLGAARDDVPQASHGIAPPTFVDEARSIIQTVEQEVWTKVPPRTLPEHELHAVQAALERCTAWLLTEAQDRDDHQREVDYPLRSMEGDLTLGDVAETIMLEPKLQAIASGHLESQEHWLDGMRTEPDQEDAILAAIGDEIEWRGVLALRIKSTPLVWNILGRARRGAGKIDLAVEAFSTAWHEAEKRLGITDRTPASDEIWDFGFARSPLFENYLEARMSLAELLERSGNLRAAAGHYSHMYRWAIRHDHYDTYFWLLDAANCLMQLDDSATLQHLLAVRGSDRDSLWWTATAAWVAWRKHGPDSVEAERARTRANTQNAYLSDAVAAYVRLHRDPPKRNEWQSHHPSEVDVYLHATWAGWKAQSAALAWLANP